MNLLRQIKRWWQVLLVKVFHYQRRTAHYPWVDPTLKYGKRWYDDEALLWLYEELTKAGYGTANTSFKEYVTYIEDPSKLYPYYMYTYSRIVFNNHKFHELVLGKSSDFISVKNA